MEVLTGSILVDRNSKSGKRWPTAMVDAHRRPVNDREIEEHARNMFAPFTKMKNPNDLMEYSTQSIAIQY